MKRIHERNDDRFNLKRVENREVLEGSKVEEVDPKFLINSKRFDIMAKYIYGKCVLNNIESKWAYNLYENHLWVFNRYDEDDGSGKKGIKKFVNSYHKTLESIKENGFDEEKSIIPVDENYVPIDGAHRIATAALLGEKVKIQRFKGSHQGYNYKFFQDKGMLTRWSDEMAYEYCQIKGNTYIWVIKRRTEDEMKMITKYLGDAGVGIYYEKLVKFNNKVKKISISRNEKKDEYLTVFLLEFPEKASLNKLKNDFQTRFNCGVYMSKTKDETNTLSQRFFKGNIFNDNNSYKGLELQVDKELIKYCLNKVFNRGKLILIDLKQNIRTSLEGRKRI
ncbi:hypothetical protein [Halobacillus sp. K22]|uniref:hypothetical protein n=1 Tax=Halobacillus sp. K22 TaxID=3457431 RepID=UPI003FCE6638